jgi:hypothetical protein
MEVNIPIEVKPGQPRCPRCFGIDLVRSRHRGVLDKLMRRFGREPMHCRFCGRRFYYFPRKAEETEPDSGPPMNAD